VFGFDPLYVAIFIVTIAVSTAAQLYVKRSYAKYSQLANGSGLTGLEVGVALVKRTTLGDRSVPRVAAEPAVPGIQVEAIRFSTAGGELSDHYDPGSHTVFLSEGVATTASVAAMAIVAHELGHAEQRETSSALLGLRSFLVPAIRFSPVLAYVCLLAGLFLHITQLVWLGVLFYAALVAFVVLDLPVEIDASRRALRLLHGAGLIRNEGDEVGTKRMLNAAASTYLAAAVSSVLQLLYFMSLGKRRE
jgi:Zn-dependent membrane protease YugP